MTKKIRLFLTMLMLTLFGGVNAAWAASVDITPSEALAGGVSPITVTCAKGDGTSNPAISSGQLRLYQAASGKTTGNTITFSSAKTIQSIVFTFANNMTADNGVFDVGSYDSDTYTWTGSANSVTLTVTGTKSGERIYITAMTVTYEDGGTSSETVATPTFSPAAGTFAEAQEVEISCATSGATIYYTLDGNSPTTSSDEYDGAIDIDETTTIKAIAVKEGMNNSVVAEATYTIVAGATGESYDIDFEYDASIYTNWTFTNIVSNYTNSGVPAHGGSKYGSTDGKASGSIQTKEKIATPNTLTCYVSKQSTNTSASTWYVQVSQDGSSWTDVESISASSMQKGEWKELTAYLTDYSDVYVRVYYSGSTAVRNIDDLTLTTTAPAVAKPTFSVAAGTYDAAQSVEISCETADASIYYTLDGTDPTNQSTAYEGAISIAETTTIKAIAYVGDDHSAVASATYTINLPLTVSTIAEARAKATDTEVLVHGVVTSVYTRTAYIEDGTAAIVVYGDNNLSVAAGDVISVRGVLTDYHGLLEIKTPTIESYDGTFTVNVNNFTIDQITNDDQAEVVRIENATVNSIDNQDVTIAQGQNTILVRFNKPTEEIEFEVGDVISLTGNIGCYNDVQIANPREISIKRDKYYVAGTWTNWNTDMIEMTKNADGTYTLDGQTLENGAQFKIVKEDTEGNTTWYGGDTQGQGETYGVHSEWCTDIALTAGDNAKNFVIQAGKTSEYTFTVDVENMTFSVTGWPVPTYYLAGSFNNWGDKAEFTHEGEGIYTLTKELEAETELKVVSEANQWFSTNPAELTRENSTDLQLSTDNQANMYIAPAGNYTFTLNANNMTLTVSGWPNPEVEGNVFVKVTDDADLTDGYYLIVNEDASVAFDGSLETLDANENNITVTINGYKIFADNTNKAAVFMITAGDEGYTITNLDDLTIGNSSDSNGLKTGNYTNAISFDDNGNADIVSASSHLRYNSTTNAKRFRYYKSSSYTGQKAVQLYKLTTLEDEVIPVTISSVEYATLYYSDKSFEIPEGVTASIVTSIDNKTVVFEELNGVIPAGTGVVLNGPQGSYDFKVVNENVSAPANNLLRGFDYAHLTEGGDKYYMLSLNAQNDPASVGFYFGEEEGGAFECGAHKAYLALPNDGEYNIKSFYLFNSEEVPTGINAVETAEQGATIYNLNGQRVNKTQKGLYIMNGKKVMVK